MLRFYLWNTILSITNFLSTKWSCKSPFEGWKREIHSWSTHQGREGTESWIPEAHQERLPHSVSPRPVRDLYQKTRQMVSEKQHLRLLSGFYTCVCAHNHIHVHLHQHTLCAHTQKRENTPSDGWIMIFLNLCSSVGCLVYFLCLYTNKHFSTYVSAWAFFLSPFFICINIFVINCIEEDLSFIFLGKPDQELFMKNFLHIMNLFFHVICTSVHFSETNSVWYGIPLPKWAISTFKNLVHLVNKNESHWEIWFSKNYCKSLYTYLYQNLLYLLHIYILFNNVLLNIM